MTSQSFDAAANGRAPLMGETHQQLGEKVRDFLRERITSGELAPGDRLVERAIAQELGVSRVPVRDAINMLKGEGFLTEVPRRGAVVTSMSRDDINELFDVREALEVLAVRLATTRSTPGELEELRQVVDDARTSLERGDMAAVAAGNQAFHDMITSMAHNELLTSLMHPLEGRLHWLLRQNDDPTPLYVEHRELLEAIASGDADEAARVSLRHVQTSRDLCLRLLFTSSPPSA